ncbi:MAG: hypothetical protein R3Y43_06390, partial [Alphaproteobacteria bacterium]
AKDGCLITYDKPGSKEKVEAYLKENPNAFQTASQVEKLIDFLKSDVALNRDGVADLYDTDTSFAAGLTDAPAKEDLQPGVVFSGVKKKEVIKVVMVKEGEEFGGATAGKGGAALRQDAKGDIKMIQMDEFNSAYKITRRPESNAVMKDIQRS